jgi:hypothetical protein
MLKWGFTGGVPNYLLNGSAQYRQDLIVGARLQQTEVHHPPHQSRVNLHALQSGTMPSTARR